MTLSSSSLIISDTSVLINFLKIDRVDLLGNLPPRILVTEHVCDEITNAYPDQLTRYEASLNAGFIEAVSVDPLEESALLIQLRKDHQLGMGECSAFAAALHRQAALAIDDSRAIKKLRPYAPSMTILGTQDCKRSANPSF